MEISSSLKLLAEKFKDKGYTLYIVGGYVRDSLLLYTPKDIDLASNMPLKDVVSLCKENKFKTTIINKNLGTIQIKFKKEEFEYTQFRSESYHQSGNHLPDQVIFVDDMKTDALRRDITINSLYYDICEDKIIDLLGGRKDLFKCRIKTCREPQITLNDDGLRILRLIRFASNYAFKFTPKTYKALKQCRLNLKDISKERILSELKQLAIADLKYNKYNHIFLKTFSKLKLFELTFGNPLVRMKKLSSNDINNFYLMDRDARLIGLYVIILKNYLRVYTPSSQLAYAVNIILGRNGLKESNDNIHTTEKVYLIYQNLENNVDILNASINYLTLSDAERNIIVTLLNKKSKALLFDNIDYIRSKNLPLSVHELKITPKELIDAGIQDKYISKIQSTLYNQVIEMKVANKTEDLIKLAKDINDTFTQITK